MIQQLTRLPKNGCCQSGSPAAAFNPWTFLNKSLALVEEGLNGDALPIAVGELSMLAKSLHIVEELRFGKEGAGAQEAPYHKAFVMSVLSDIAQVELRVHVEGCDAASSVVRGALADCQRRLAESLQRYHPSSRVGSAEAVAANRIGTEVE
jgi:hypothetical protein